VFSNFYTRGTTKGPAKTAALCAGKGGGVVVRRRHGPAKKMVTRPACLTGRGNKWGPGLTLSDRERDSAPSLLLLQRFFDGESQLERESRTGFRMARAPCCGPGWGAGVTPCAAADGGGGAGDPICMERVCKVGLQVDSCSRRGGGQQVKRQP
jgi:hypothetical protein